MVYELDLSLILNELEAGYLVNIREVSRDGLPWGPENNFDVRCGHG
jgi:hypothetical protein